MTTEDDFQNALAATPGDWHTLLVLADWLQDRGDPRAEGYRALGVLRRAPSLFGVKRVWLNARYAAAYEDTEDKRTATLPDDWYALIPRAGANYSCAAERTSQREALDDAARAFTELPPGRRAELLREASR